MNKKGFTTTELLLSFTLTVLVMGFLFSMLLNLKDLYIGSSIKTNLLIKQAVIVSKVNEDLIDNKIASVTSCGTDCMALYFIDGVSKELKIDRENKIFTYGDYNTKLAPGSSFGVVEIYTETQYTVADGYNNSILQIKIPIEIDIYKDEDFGINAVYQYDNRIYNLSEFDF